MPYEYTPPKYAQVIAELQRRIENGEYPPGSLMPSEHQLSGEFGIARPTVVRALRVLRQEGWIETQQGKGSFVRGRPALAEVTAARRGAGGAGPGRVPGAWRAGVRRPGRATAEDRGAARLAGGPGGAVPQAADPPGRRPVRGGHVVVPPRPGRGHQPRRRELRCTAGSGLTWPGARASGWITWSSRSPPATRPRMRSSCSASPGRRRSSLCTCRPVMRPGLRCSRWMWRCRGPCTSWKTPIQSART